MDTILYKKPNILGKIRKESFGGIFWMNDMARIDMLNDVAVDILEKCNGSNTVSKIIDQILEDYDVLPQKAEVDVIDYLLTCAAVGYINGIDISDEIKEKAKSKFDTTTPNEYCNFLGENGLIGVGKNTLSAPMKVLIEFTKNCNLRCVHCFADADCRVTSDGYLDGELTKEQWFQIIDNVKEAEVFDIFVSGGEALLRKDFFDIMEYIKEKGLEFCLLTNATLITDEIAKKLKAFGCFKVEANMDGFDEDSYDSFRGCKGSFAATVNGIKACLKNDLPIRCNVTITKINIKWLKQIADTAYQIGVREVCCVPLEQGGRADANWERLHVTVEDNVEFHYSEVTQYVQEKYGDKMMFIAPIERHVANDFGEDNKVHAFWDPNGLMPACGAGKYHCSINPFGDVILCPTAGDFVKFEPNGLLKHSLRDVWTNAQTFVDIRNTMPKQCFGCKHIECDRGCALTMYRKYGRMDVQIEDECLNIQGGC
jgi:radical SAM protein with 4Fe4S-binding SPASM domain